MSQTRNRLLLGAGLTALLCATASGQVVNTLNITQPHANGVTTTEVVGRNSVVKFTLPAGLDAGGSLADGQAINVAIIRGLDSAGSAVTGDVNVAGGLQNISGGGVYDDAAGNTGEVDLSAVAGLDASVFGVVGVVSVQIAITTNGSTITSDACQTRFNAAAETGAAGTADECLTVDSTVPSITLARRNSGGTRLFLTYSEALSNGNAANDDNHTVLGNVTLADFQFNTTNTFGAGTGNPPATFTVQGSFTDGTDRTIIEVDITGNSTVTTGTFIRTAADAGNLGISDVKDVVGNPAAQSSATTGVQITALADLAITGVRWIETVADNGTTVEAIEVTYNLPLDNAGNLAFYGGASGLTVDGGTSDILLDGTPTIDSNDTTKVLIDVDAQGGGGDAVGPNGLLVSSRGDASTGTFSLTTVLAGTRASSIFSASGTEYAAAETEDIGDGVDPSVDSRVFLDQDGDGDLDAAAIVFDEPVSTTTVIANWTLAGVNGVTVHPFHQITAAGALTADTTSGTPTITIASVTVGSVDRDGDNEVQDDETNSAIILAFNPDNVDWDADSTTRPTDATEATPGTGDGGAFTSAWNGTNAITDASANTFDGTITTAAHTVDRAEPVAFRFDFLTGDNQPNGNNNQLFFEQEALNTGRLGDNDDNNRLRMIFSEDLQAIANSGAIAEETVQFGTTGATFEDGEFFSNSPQNTVTLLVEHDEELFDIGTVIAISPTSATSGTNIQDTAGNWVSLTNQATVDRVALYAANTLDVNGDVTPGAFLIDTDNDGFVNQIRIRMTRPVLSSTVQVADFSIDSGGTITAVAVDTNDANTIILTVTDGVVSINNTVTLTYNGAADTTPISSTGSGGGNSVPVSAVNDSVTIAAIATSDTDTRDVAVMPLVGTITTNGTTPAPFGTKVFAMIAVPTVREVTATHNNVEFTIRRGDRYSSSNESSFEAWTNWWLGLERDLYLLRDSQNRQFYENTKFADENNDGTPENSQLGDAIKLTVNDRNSSAVTFTGTGESSSSRVTGGRVAFCWDVLRSENGTLQRLYDRGFEIGGTPIISSGVVTDTSGRYEMHVSAPISAFTGQSRFNSIGWPVILVVELPNGQRSVASSLLTSVNGDPLLFAANNRTQTSDDANNAVTFNINLNNIGTQAVHSEWNTVAYGRAGGFARATSNRPVLASGVTTGNVRVGTALANVDPVDQWVFWNDDSVDGVWTIDDDSSSNSPLDSVIIDADCFPNFSFTMTSFGVQVSSGMTNLVGGYALGFFNGTTSDYGVFQFGAPLSGLTVFGNSALFPNNSTTQGWALATVSGAYSNPATFPSNNSRADYMIIFANNGTDGIDVNSIDLANPGGSDNPNDISSIAAGTAAFIHYTAN